MRVALAGHGSGSSPRVSARWVAVFDPSGSPARAAAAAARRATSGSSRGSASRMTMTSSSSRPTPSASGATTGPDVVIVVGRDSRTSSTRRHARAARWARRRPMLRVCSSSSSGSRPRNRAASTMWSGSSFSNRRPDTSCRASRTSSSADRRPSDSPCGTSTSHVATSARIITPSRSPPPDSLRSGTAECASQPDRCDAGLAGLAHLGQPTSSVAAPVGEHLGAEREHEPRVAGHRAGVEHPGGGAVVERGRLAHLHGVAHRVVEGDAAVPQRVPDRLGDLPHALLGHGGIVQQDDVEVAGRRQLGTAVPADRDEREPLALTRVVAGTHRLGEQPAEQPVGLERAVAALLREVGRWRVGHSLQRGLVGLAGANPHDRLDRDDPHLAVADLARAGGGRDGRDDRLGVGVVDDDLEAGSSAPASLRTRRRGRPRCGPSAGRGRWPR